MQLEARQKAAKATTARSTRVNDSSRCAKTMPTKMARFFVHCRGRRAVSNANKRPPVPSGEGGFVLADISSVGGINWLLRSVCFVAMPVFSKNAGSLRRQKAWSTSPYYTYSDDRE